ncbi:MAG TPA: PAS domain S-box protein, partial [Candidatus Nitrosocosmicus sp.]|nr:PAS domain S-box protein [Candidatus Nitrosocosmicus sp.]
EMMGLKRDTVLITKNGDEKYVSACISPIKVSDGNIGVVIVFRDITRIKQTEEKLITEQQNLTLIFDAAPIGMLLIDENSVIKKVNKSMLHIVGRYEQEVINQKIGNGLGCINSYKDENGCGFSNLCGKCELRRTLNEISSSRETMLGIETYHTLLIDDNEKGLWLKINSVPVTIDGKKHVVLVIDDITMDKQVERELEKSRDFYLTLFENFPALIWRAGLDGKCDYFNKSWLEFTGRTLEQEMGDGWNSGVHPEDLEYCFNTYIKAFNFREAFDMEYRLRRFDGEYRWIIDMGRPFYDLNGIFSGYIGSCYDITERKTAEEGLRRYQLLSESANDIIIFSDINGGIIEANSAALISYGYAREEIIDKSIFELVSPDNRSPVRTQSYKINAEGVYYEATARRKDGSTFPVEVSLQGAEIGGSKVLLSILRDITERKQIQKELERAREYAEAANLAKSEFLANMSHEIRTPLNGMLGMIDLTLLTGLTEEQKENLFIAKGCASTLLNLINDILDFSRIEARKLALENIAFDFVELVEQTIKPHTVKAREKGLELRYRLDPQTPQIVNGDPNRLKQVINNLLGNAVKFTEAGEINLLTSLKNSTDDYVELEFQISDTGVGIDSRDIGGIFDTFSQADSSITRKYGGSGLGLAISRQLVELMGGAIWVESEKGKGSTFYFTMIITVGRETSSTRQSIKTIAKTKYPLQILLAEDDRINQVVITRMIKEAGHFAETANNGLEALQAINEKSIDVVLMDIQMPEMDGIEAVKRVRKSEKGTGRHIPIIALTAHALQGDRERYLAAGMDDYIAKPVQLNSLL